MQECLPIRYFGDRVKLLDQTLLPVEETYFDVCSAKEMWDAIKKLQVRGAPAIGIAAAYGVCLEMHRLVFLDPEAFRKKTEEVCDYLGTSRPTAVNLFWALERMKKTVKDLPRAGSAELYAALVEEARKIEQEETDSCIAIGENLLGLLHDGMGLLTHCNAGGIATMRYGTALAPMLLGAERGMHFHVFADETRPLLQGARLTAWELQRAGVDVTLITDNMAAMVMKQGKVDAVIVGCDRVAANGDVANKIGTYGVAVLAKEHGIPFYVAAPVSTIDPGTATGDQIVIEERDPKEVACGFGRRTAPEGVRIYNPAFDVTPAKYVTAIVTNRGILYPPYPESICALLAKKEGEV